MKTSSYKELDLWKKAIDLTKKIYLLISKLPKEETFGLCNQIRRSVVSIPSNIAEGHGRYSNKEFIHFLSIARGSLCELETQLIICKEIGFLSLTDINESISLINDIGKMIIGLSNYLERKSDSTMND